MSLNFAPSTSASIALHIITSAECAAILADMPAVSQTWARSQGFSGGLGQICPLPDEAGAIAAILIGYGTPEERQRARFHLGAAANKLPDGTYHLERTPEGFDTEGEALGWLLARYHFDRYRKQSHNNAALVAPKGVDAARLEAIATGDALTRDLVNTPTSDLGPEQLQAAFFDLAATHDAKAAAIVGADLLTQNFPMIHTVGRASAQEPRLLDMRWGSKGPKLTLVGKGVCFDTGGLNIKPGASMGLMKKDMGGSAAVMGLAHMIMALKLPLQLRVLVPAVENSIDGSAFRPSDILTSRKGLTVEINNTDAEGRLVLADALALADEEDTDLVISMATLTGAARVAVGPDLAPFFSDDAGVVAALETAGERVADPVWRLPFHTPYEAMIEPGIADLDNAPKGGFAGAITAALFLRRFVTNAPRYAHFDIYGWQVAAAPGRPKGAIGQGGRAILDALPDILKL